MALLIPTKPKPAATTLEAKTDGFKFTLPTANAKPEAATTPIVEQPLIQPANKPDANKLLIGQSKSGSASLIQKSPTLVPEMSVDKYEVVIGSQPEFTAEAGDKFQVQLGMLRDAIDGDGVLKDQMVNILTFLDDNPEYKDNISTKDVAVFVAGCRKIAGITVTEKVVRKKKTTTNTAAVQDVLDDLADLSFDL